MTHLNGWAKNGTVWSAITPFGLEWSHDECPTLRNNDSQVPKKCSDEDTGGYRKTGVVDLFDELIRFNGMVDDCAVASYFMGS
ncbi:hypothetical protein AVEN_6928-1 [Araneus ventricosus]|uniref:Uncharacterized protein n=1 Tax=Araneus ventricosus TaxID=182803 RepID=A0A4Y2VQ54_ARAVE|nr:hypothetical protein AVEN_6928-1 [Araneus ventricosus]